jgi:hypothetical protein
VAISLLFIAFIGFILLLYTPNNSRESIVKAILFFSLITIGITELLGLFNALNYINLVLTWGITDVILIYLAIKKRSFRAIYSVKSRVIYISKNLNKWEWFLITFSVFILIGVFIQGLIYPTNNWDSMSYHMARITHWIQNESLAHYRTTLYSQLISPPFAEELILNINLLCGNDYLSNAVQLFYLLATSLSISMVAKQLGLNKFGQILSTFILITIPEVILLSSSTHTELVVSFFLVTSIYYFLKTRTESGTLLYFWLGSSLGLAVATKSTAFIYITPFILIWIGYQIYQLFSQKMKLKWMNYFVLILVFGAINAGHYIRNYQLTSNVLGTNTEIRNYYVNEVHSLPMIISNVSRNISLQFGVPKAAPVAYKLTEQLHQLIGAGLNDPKTTSHTYDVDPLAIHENNGANIYHTLLMFLSLLWILVRIKKQNIRFTLYWLAILLSFLLFCFYLKWQPWAKLHAPFFIFYSIVLAHFVITNFKSKILLFIIIFGFVGSATLTMLFNFSRPYITYYPFTSEIKITDARYKKYFGRFLQCYPDFKSVNDKITALQLKNIGLMYGDYGMEYQLFLNSYRSDIKSIHINSHEICDNIPVKEEVDCIVTTSYQDSIIYQNEIYYNATKENDEFLFLFLKDGF